MKKKLEALRIENSSLSDKIKGKYATVSCINFITLQKQMEIQSEIDKQQQIFSEGFTEGSKTKNSSFNKSKKGNRVEDFMKIKASRDSLNQKKDAV